MSLYNEFMFVNKLGCMFVYLGKFAELASKTRYTIYEKCYL